MKATTFLLATVLFWAQGAVINNPEDELRKFEYCVQRSQVRPEYLKALSIGNFVNDPKLKEYLYCISTATGYQDKSGYLQSDNIRLKMKAGRFSDELIDEVVQLCTTEKESPQETAYQFMKCFYNQILPKKYT